MEDIPLSTDDSGFCSQQELEKLKKLFETGDKVGLVEEFTKLFQSHLEIPKNRFFNSLTMKNILKLWKNYKKLYEEVHNDKSLPYHDYYARLRSEKKYEKAFETYWNDAGKTLYAEDRCSLECMLWHEVENSPGEEVQDEEERARKLGVLEEAQHYYKLMFRAWVEDKKDFDSLSKVHLDLHPDVVSNGNSKFRSFYDTAYETFKKRYVEQESKMDALQALNVDKTTLRLFQEIEYSTRRWVKFHCYVAYLPFVIQICQSIVDKNAFHLSTEVEKKRVWNFFHSQLQELNDTLHFSEIQQKELAIENQMQRRHWKVLVASDSRLEGFVDIDNVGEANEIHRYLPPEWHGLQDSGPGGDGFETAEVVDGPGWAGGMSNTEAQLKCLLRLANIIDSLHK